MPKIVVSRCSVFIEDRKSAKEHHRESCVSNFIKSIIFLNFRHFRHFEF